MNQEIEGPVASYQTNGKSKLDQMQVLLNSTLNIIWRAVLYD